VKYNELKELLVGGKQPMVKFNKAIDDCEVFGQPGMLARITHVVKERDGVSCIMVDYAVAKEHNLALQDHNWWIGSTNKTGTIFEAGMMKEDQMQAALYVDMDDKFDMPFDLVAEEGTPLAEYMKEKADPAFKMTYGEWLERQWKELKDAVRAYAEEAAGESL